MKETGLKMKEIVDQSGFSSQTYFNRLFKRKYLLGDDGEIVKTKGELMDVPVNSWIDVRLDMPDEPAFNQGMSQELEP